MNIEKENMLYMLKRFKESIIIKIVWLLPKSIIYWSVIRGMASVNLNHPDDMTATDYLKALEVK
jgi:hypothetical protein